MSKCNPKNEEFMSNIKRELDLKYGTTSDICLPFAYHKITYEAKPYYCYAKRDYVLEITVEMDRPIAEFKAEMIRVLKKLGADSNILTGTHRAISRKYMQFCFDEKLK